MMNPNVRFLTRTALLLALTLAVQMIALPQPVTGPLVNMFLYIAVFFVGMMGAGAIGLVTPLIAFSRGILPPPLAPMIPFIILGNICLVVIFGLLRKVNKYLALAIASTVKFLILAGGVRYFVEVKPAIAKAMSTPQLINALIGGVIALIIHEILVRTKAIENMKA